MVVRIISIAPGARVSVPSQQTQQSQAPSSQKGTTAGQSSQGNQSPVQPPTSGLFTPIPKAQLEKSLGQSITEQEYQRRIAQQSQQTIQPIMSVPSSNLRDTRGGSSSSSSQQIMSTPAPIMSRAPQQSIQPSPAQSIQPTQQLMTPATAEDKYLRGEKTEGTITQRFIANVKGRAAELNPYSRPEAMSYANPTEEKVQRGLEKAGYYASLPSAFIENLIKTPVYEFGGGRYEERRDIVAKKLIKKQQEEDSTPISYGGMSTPKGEQYIVNYPKGYSETYSTAPMSTPEGMSFVPVEVVSISGKNPLLSPLDDKKAQQQAFQELYPKGSKEYSFYRAQQLGKSGAYLFGAAVPAFGAGVFASDIGNFGTGGTTPGDYTGYAIEFAPLAVGGAGYVGSKAYKKLAASSAGERIASKVEPYVNKLFPVETRYEASLTKSGNVFRESDTGIKKFESFTGKLESFTGRKSDTGIKQLDQFIERRVLPQKKKTITTLELETRPEGKIGLAAGKAKGTSYESKIIDQVIQEKNVIKTPKIKRDFPSYTDQLNEATKAGAPVFEVKDLDKGYTFKGLTFDQKSVSEIEPTKAFKQTVQTIEPGHLGFTLGYTTKEGEKKNIGILLKENLPQTKAGEFIANVKFGLQKDQSFGQVMKNYFKGRPNIITKGKTLEHELIHYRNPYLSEEQVRYLSNEYTKGGRIVQPKITKAIEVLTPKGSKTTTEFIGASRKTGEKEGESFGLAISKTKGGKNKLITKDTVSMDKYKEVLTTRTKLPDKSIFRRDVFITKGGSAERTTGGLYKGEIASQGKVEIIRKILPKKSNAGSTDFINAGKGSATIVPKQKGTIGEINKAIDNAVSSVNKNIVERYTQEAKPFINIKLPKINTITKGQTARVAGFPLSSYAGKGTYERTAEGFSSQKPRVLQPQQSVSQNILSIAESSAPNYSKNIMSRGRNESVIIPKGRIITILKTNVSPRGNQRTSSYRGGTERYQQPQMITFGTQGSFQTEQTQDTLNIQLPKYQVILPTETVQQAPAQAQVPYVPFIPFVAVPSGNAQGGRGRSIRSREVGRKYRPSLAAIALGIKGKVNKKMTFTGAELRPISISVRKTTRGRR